MTATTDNHATISLAAVETCAFAGNAPFADVSAALVTACHRMVKVEKTAEGTEYADQGLFEI